MAISVSSRLLQSLMGLRTIALLSILALLAQLPQSVAAGNPRSLPWPVSQQDRSSLKCFTDSNRPECLTYKQLQDAFAQRKAGQSSSARRKPQLQAPLLPSLSVPVLVAPTSTVTTTAAPSTDATAAPLTVPEADGGFITPRASRPPVKIFLTGDSLTHGREGDWTWRYRVWQWFRANKIPVTFVGPYNGTITPPSPAPPPRPVVPGDPAPPDVLVWGSGYHKPVTAAFNKLTYQHQHFAYWGRTAAYVIPYMQGMVSTYQPDFVFTALGYNDMVWIGTSVADMLNYTSQLIGQARQANPNVKFAIADVTHSAMTTFDEIDSRVDAYNAALPSLLASLNSTTSPIAHVTLSSTYACGPGYCPAAYDPAHPNALGEFQIAQAFARGLRAVFFPYATDFVVPSNIPVRSTPIPTRVNATGSGPGVTVTWAKVYGALSYDVQYRVVGSSDWSLARVDTERYDTTWTFPGQQWEYQVRTDNLNSMPNASLVSDWSPIVRATANPQLASAPPNITITPTASGFDVSWQPATGAYSDTVDLYQVLFIDMDTPGAYLGGTATRGLSTSLTNMTPGHRYATWVASWNANGGGLPGASRPVTPGGAPTPAVPTNLLVNATDAVTVALSWCGDPSAAGYRIWARNAAANETLHALDGVNGFVTRAGIAYLFPGTWNYEFCVSAVNGAGESAIGECVRAGGPGEVRGTPFGSSRGDGGTGDSTDSTDPPGVCYDGTVPGTF